MHSIICYNNFNVQKKGDLPAGDSFIAGFIKKISEHKTLEEAIIFANKVASISVTKNGSSESIPTLEEVEERFKNV
ncbi:PfkB family carbohydrate kinase [Mycoplasmopsis agassizii]|uniref:PfkB family carbohydrate kinase n=1 Tax=Mycoplasmopsis agassizii TaxID=33922 RepID=UPI0035299BE0